MAKHTFTYDVTRRITVQLDDTKFTTEVMEDFNRCITDFGTDDDAYRDHAVHIATRALDGADFDPHVFQEGYGVIGLVGITVTIEDEMSFDPVEGPSP